MRNDLKEILERSILPEKISGFLFEGKKDPGDGALLIGYFSEDYGIIAITIYKFGEEIPDDITNDKVINEFQLCVNSVFELEELGIYSNVELLKKEVCNSTNEECEAHHAFYQFLHLSEDEAEELIPTFSILILVTEGEYYHKIRYSVSISEAEKAHERFEEFLHQWVGSIRSLNFNIN